MILKQNGIWGEIMYENVEYDQHFIGEFDVEGDSFNGELIFNKKNGGILIHIITAANWFAELEGFQEYAFS